MMITIITTTTTTITIITTITPTTAPTMRMILSVEPGFRQEKSQVNSLKSNLAVRNRILIESLDLSTLTL